MLSFKFIFVLAFIGSINSAPLFDGLLGGLVGGLTAPLGGILPGQLGGVVGGAVNTVGNLVGTAANTAINTVSLVGTAANNVVQTLNALVQNLVGSLGRTGSIVDYKLHDMNNMINYIMMNPQANWGFNPWQIIYYQAIPDLQQYCSAYPQISQYLIGLKQFIESNQQISMSALKQISQTLASCIIIVDPQGLLTSQLLGPLADTLNQASGSVNQVHSCWMDLAGQMTSN